MQGDMLPPFVDCTNVVQHYLTDAGVKAVCRLLSVIAHERPDITYSPLLFTLTAILLHYLDEAACYTCVSSLVTSKHRYIAQTVISHQAQTHALSELSLKYVVCILVCSDSVLLLALLFEQLFTLRMIVFSKFIVPIGGFSCWLQFVTS